MWIKIGGAAWLGDSKSVWYYNQGSTGRLSTCKITSYIVSGSASHRQKTSLNGVFLSQLGYPHDMEGNLYKKELWVVIYTNINVAIDI